MAKVITFTKPTNAITDLSGSLSAGGTLAPNTTYYYVVLVLGNGATEIYNNYGTLSGISNEFSITTDSTNRTVNLTWSAITGASRYLVFRRTTSGTHYLSSFLSNLVVSTNSAIDNGSSSIYNPVLPLVPSGQLLPMGITPRIHGVGDLVYYGGTEADPITPQDIYNAAVADGWTDYCKWDGNTLLVLGNFRPDSSNAAQLFFRNITFVCCGYFYSYGATGSRIRYGELNSIGQAVSGVKFLFGFCANYKQFWIGSNTELYNCVVDSCNSPNPLYLANVIGHSIYNNFNGGKGKDIMFRNYTSFFARTDLPVSGLKLQGYFNTIYNDCKLFSNIECSYQRLTYGVNSRIDTFAFLNNSYQINEDHAGCTDNFIDCLFPNTTDSDKLPVISWYNQTSTVQLWNSILLKVLDEAGNPISNATIVIKDKNGNTITDFAGKSTYTTDNAGVLFSEKISITGATSTTITDSSKSWTTNQWLGYNIFIASGNGINQKAKVLSNTATTITITEPFLVTPSVGDYAGIITEIKTAIMTYGGSTYVSNKSILNPFTITISKAGYETYYQKQNITSKIDQTITLKKAVPILLSDKGQVFLKKNKENQGSGRSLIFNL